MKKSTLAAFGGTGVAALALISAMAQADSLKHVTVSELELDMALAATKASDVISGKVIEAELEMDDGRAIWEIEIVNATQQVIKVEVDGKTGQVISTESDDDTGLMHTEALTLAKAIEVVKSDEGGALVEAELEREHGQLIWEIKTIGTSDGEQTFRVHAETGEILI